jgi:hypothetical protein
MRFDFHYGIFSPIAGTIGEEMAIVNIQDTIE